MTNGSFDKLRTTIRTQKVIGVLKLSHHVGVTNVKTDNNAVCRSEPTKISMIQKRMGILTLGISSSLNPLL